MDLRMTARGRLHAIVGARTGGVGHVRVLDKLVEATELGATRYTGTE